jgi:hypothetical protein
MSWRCRRASPPYPRHPRRDKARTRPALAYLQASRWETELKTLEECRAHIDDVFRQALPEEAVRPDAEGRRWFAYGSATLIVSVAPGFGAPFVSVVAPLLRDVAKTSALLEAINELNESAGIGCAYWADGVVVVKEKLVAETVTVEKLMPMIFVIGRVADSLDDVLRERFGGAPMFGSQPAALRLR